MSEPIGRAKGGVARALALSPERKLEISLKGVAAKKALAGIPRATHGKEDHPLRIGAIEIPCYVLADKRRVIVQRGMLTAMDMSQGTAGRGGGDRIAKFAATKGVSSRINNDLQDVISNPILFITPNGTRAYGYEATVLADLCDAVLETRKSGELHHQQEHIAARCEVLVRAFARVGIIALVDEATGYQKDREKFELAKILESFVAKELQPYVKTFPSDYYEELFRLRGLKFPATNTRFRPQYFGCLTNDIVYERLAPGILEELKRQSKKDEKKAHLHRRLTLEVGHPKLREHLASVVMAMKLSQDYQDFITKLNRVHPRFGRQLLLELEIEDR